VSVFAATLAMSRTSVKLIGALAAGWANVPVSLMRAAWRMKVLHVEVRPEEGPGEL
jgi:hypothetical protein